MVGVQKTIITNCIIKHESGPNKHEKLKKKVAPEMLFCCNVFVLP
jgi:hypothetical protein